jgi:hypothetical protein
MLKIGILSFKTTMYFQYSLEKMPVRPTTLYFYAKLFITSMCISRILKKRTHLQTKFRIDHSTGSKTGSLKSACRNIADTHPPKRLALHLAGKNCNTHRDMCKCMHVYSSV